MSSTEGLVVKGPYLGAFEELVLLAVQGLGDDAYGASLQRTLERETGRPISLGAVHTALERLETKNLLQSELGEPLNVRGGRRRRIFSVTTEGATMLRATRTTRNQLAALRRSTTG